MPRSRKKPAKTKPISAEEKRIGIIGPNGDLWTQMTFDTMDDAKAHVEGFRDTMPERAVGVQKYNCVPVLVTITVIHPR